VHFFKNCLQKFNNLNYTCNLPSNRLPSSADTFSAIDWTISSCFSLHIESTLGSWKLNKVKLREYLHNKT